MLAGLHIGSSGAAPPNEHPLDLGRAQLFELDSVVQSMRGRCTRTVLRDFTVWPRTP